MLRCNRAESIRFTCLLLTGTEEIIYKLNITTVINIRATNFYHHFSLLLFFLFLMSPKSSDVSTESRFFEWVSWNSTYIFLIAYLVQRKLQQIECIEPERNSVAADNLHAFFSLLAAHFHCPNRRSHFSRLKIAISFGFFFFFITKSYEITFAPLIRSVLNAHSARHNRNNKNSKCCTLRICEFLRTNRNVLLAMQMC